METTTLATGQVRTRPFQFLFDRTSFLGPVFLAPAIIYIVLLIAFPFFLAIYYSLSAFNIFNMSFKFVGLRNFIDIFQDDVFLQTLGNTFIFTIVSNIIGLALGKATALLLLRKFPGKSVVRFLIILPWAVPVALATLAWRWMFDSLYSVINWSLQHAHLISAASWPNWLGEPSLAMISVIAVHSWRLFPFGAVIFLAGLTSIPKDVLDACTVDGAGFFRRNFQILVPMMAPIILVAGLFGTVFTFTDLSVVYLLTKGGPINSTHVLGSLAFQVGILSGDVSHGAAISLCMFPFLLIASIFLLRGLRRREI
jgi:multiple sugar transport system permease protein